MCMGDSALYISSKSLSLSVRPLSVVVASRDTVAFWPVDCIYGITWTVTMVSRETSHCMKKPAAIAV